MLLTRVRQPLKVFILNFVRLACVVTHDALQQLGPGFITLAWFGKEGNERLSN